MRPSTTSVVLLADPDVGCLGQLHLATTPGGCHGQAGENAPAGRLTFEGDAANVRNNTGTEVWTVNVPC